MQKIYASGIGSFVPDVQIAGLDRGKAEFLRDLAEESDGRITFIDDHTGHLVKAHEAEISVDLVRMRRPGEPHTLEIHPLDDVAWRVIASLDELE
ncbi:hypothetical protein A2348_03405 [Candidatus Uhrbacteria bacterium RIFOXYB12_FULL_58_10]|uniref:Uncharacterized protein n=1 Tax=Candidatus Uhrbacteria bacterium RIFOXYB2_FULL_57_15 TaxID=1802422 RepID=A0A1F7W5L9_9BACT|nr:MAG: hypothetical protein A2348_03405 [Candidatus Uhrbacteria bacterium RIFOXYB12_FULL_58_10]OGL98113.1 MAG: hypothetical protein A2304_03455 [Candidatus Uhrbacteria bacterium RIFOXYB2_FULL_57_15]OGM00097.1 MAG: hypothetical protein A2501_01110 [Candidatus Uhrbacteria bacterium RIFOXYC12_FULL_57_11]